MGQEGAAGLHGEEVDSLEYTVLVKDLTYLLVL